MIYLTQISDIQCSCNLKMNILLLNIRLKFSIFLIMLVELKYSHSLSSYQYIFELRFYVLAFNVSTKIIFFAQKNRCLALFNLVKLQLYLQSVTLTIFSSPIGYFEKFTTFISPFSFARSLHRSPTHSSKRIRLQKLHYNERREEA